MAKRLGELLIDKGLLDAGQLERALAQQPQRRKRLGRLLVDMGMLSEDLVIQVLGEQLQAPMMRLRPEAPTAAALALLDEPFCRHNECIPVKLHQRESPWLDLAIAEIGNTGLLERIRDKIGCRVRPYLVGPRAILAAIDCSYGNATRQGWPAVVVGEPIFAFGEQQQQQQPGQAAAASVPTLAPPRTGAWSDPDTGIFEIDVEEPVSRSMTGPELPAVSSGASAASKSTGPQPVVGDGAGSPSVAELAAQVTRLQGQLRQLGRRFDQLVSRLADAGQVGPAGGTRPAPTRSIAEQANLDRAVANGGVELVRTGRIKRADVVAEAPAVALDAEAAVIVNAPTGEEREAGQRTDTSRGRAQVRPALPARQRQQTSLTLPEGIAGALGERPLVVIDLGTSWSSVAAVKDGKATPLPLPGGRWDMPSMVAVGDDGSATVGETARELLPTKPQRVVASPKRLLGYRAADRAIEPHLANLTVPYVAGPEGQLLLQVGSSDYSVPEICAFLLRSLRVIAERHLVTRVEQAVFTVPVDFNEEQRGALTLAAKLAGLSVAEMIEEPVAAAMSNFGSPSFDGPVAVYDFGGGTFDFAVVDVSSQRVSVIAKAGDSWLGGDDFDEALAGEAANWFWRQHDLELRKQVVQWQRLLTEAERTKRRLSEDVQATMKLTDVALTSKGQLSLQYPVSRAFFKNSPAVDLIQRSFDACRAALDQAGLGPGQLNAVYLSGGTSRIPAVRDAVTRFFGRAPEATVAPERAVLLGAALFAALKRRAA